MSLANAPHNGTRTSRAAALDIDNSRYRQCDQIHAAVLGSALAGMTREEIQKATGLSGDTVRPRVLELLEAGRLVNAGELRRTSSGRMAEVLLAVEAMPAEARP